MASLGDAARRFELPPGADVRAVLAKLRAWPGVRDAVVTDRYACAYFDPHAPPIGDLASCLCATAPTPGSARDLVILRADYDGPDLAEVAGRLELDVEEVISLHTAATYTVAFVGFLPGFAYLAGLPARLVVARRETPRTRVPACALGIAGGYCGIYPFASPGGWNLIGTAVDFTPFAVESGAALSAGDRVRFERVG